MSKKKNNKGFTLVELLVAITIMGIITALALPEVRRIQANNKNKKYETYSKSLESAAKLYVDSHSTDLFGVSANACDKVSLSLDLKGSSLVKDYGVNNISCSGEETPTDASDDSYVIINKTGDKYDYKVYLVCKDENHNIVYKSSEAPVCGVVDEYGFEKALSTNGTGGKWISFNENNSQATINKATYGNIEFTIKNKTAFESINPKINYWWSECDINGENCQQKAIKTRNLSSSKDGNDNVLSAKINGIPQNGVYKLVIQPVNVITTNGKQLLENFESGIFKMDSIQPDKPIFDPATSYGWKGKTFTSAKNYVFNASTNESEKGSSLTWSYKFPSSESSFTKYASSNCVSGTDCYKIKTQVFTSEVNDNLQVKVCDQANNCSTSDKMKISIDNTLPTMTVNVTDGKTYAKSHKANIKINDTGGSSLKSGPINLYYGWGTSAPACSSLTNYVNINIPSSANSATSQDITINSGTGAGKLYVCTKDNTLSDAAGNAIDVSQLFNSDMYLDNTGPKVSASVGTTWTDNKVVITASATDSNVGTIGGYYISTSTTAPSASATGWQTGKTFSKGTGTYYIWAKDSLGNVSSSYATAVVPLQCITADNKLSKTSVTIIEKEKATVTITDGTVSSVTSSNTSVATVSGSGSTITITGVSVGTANITVEMPKGTNCSGTVKKTISVTVNPIPCVPAANTLSSTSVTINEKSTSTVTITDGTVNSATSSDTSIATVSASGSKITITGASYGSATITVVMPKGSNCDGTVTKTISVTVKPMYYYSGSTYYANLKTAVSSVSAGSTINVYRNVSESTTPTLNKNVTLNLNGKTITYSGSTLNVTAGTFTITGSGTLKTNTSYSGRLLQTAGGTLNIGTTSTVGQSYPTITQQGSNSTLLGVNSGTVNVYSGKLSSNFDGINVGSSGTLNFGKGGTSYNYPFVEGAKGASGSSSNFMAIYTTGTTNIISGKVSASQYSTVYLSSGTLTIGTQTNSNQINRTWPLITGTAGAGTLRLHGGTLKMYSGRVDNVGSATSVYNGTSGSVALDIESNYTNDLIIYGGLFYSKNACSIYTDSAKVLKVNGNTHVVTSSSANSTIHAQGNASVYVGSELNSGTYDMVRTGGNGVYLAAKNGYAIWTSGTGNAQIGSSKVTSSWADYSPTIYSGYTTATSVKSGYKIWMYSGRVFCNGQEFVYGTFANSAKATRTSSSGTYSYNDAYGSVLVQVPYKYLWKRTVS